jgi:hypothetical protein
MNDDLEFQIESRLTSHGVYVDDVTETEDGFEITYESVAVDSEEIIPHREVGRVINVFRDLHDDDWKGGDISAVVTDFDEHKFGEWEVKQEWFDKLHNGDLTEVEFSEKVIETIQHVEE